MTNLKVKTPINFSSYQFNSSRKDNTYTCNTKVLKMKFWAPEWWLQTSICSSLWNTFSRVGLSCNLMASRSARSIISRFSNSAAVSRMMSSRIISARMSPLASTWKYKEIFVHTYIYKGCAAISPNKNKTISTLGAVPRCKLSKSKWHF